MHAVCLAADVTEVRDLMFEVIEAANYPIREIQTHEGSGELTELEATLIPSSAMPGELDGMVEQLKRVAAVRSATWTVGSTS